MAGFMAGFGTAFANSFNQASAERARREDDLVRMKFEDMQATKKERQKLKAEDLKNVRLAKSLTEGVNPAAWPKVHEWLASGMSESQVIKNLQEGEFIIKPKTGENAAEAAQTQDDGSGSVDLSKTAEGAVDSQMTASGLGSKPGQGIFGRTPAPGPNGEAPSSPDESRANRRVDEATGGEYSAPQDESVSVAEDLPGSDATIEYRPKPTTPDISKIDSIDSADTARILAENNGDTKSAALYKRIGDQLRINQGTEAAKKAQAEGTLYIPQTATIRGTKELATLAGDGTWVGSDGKALGDADVIPHTKQMMLDQADAIDKTAKPVQEYVEDAQRFSSTVTGANEMLEIVNKNPDVLSAAADWSVTVNSWKNNLFGGYNVINGAVAFDDATLADLRAKEAEAQKAASTVMQGVDHLAVQRQLLEAKAVRMAYSLASFNGQTGRSVSVSEFETQLARLLPNDKNSFVESLTDIITNEGSSLEQRQKNLNNSNYVRNFESKYPGAHMTIPLALPVDEIVDPDQLAKFKELKSHMDDRNNPDTGIVGDDPSDPAPEGIDPEDWKWMEEGDRALWRKKK